MIAKDSRIAALTASFSAHFGRPPQVLVRTPGRVNLLGEHVDYNDGLVLPAAIDRTVLIAAARSDDAIIRLVAPDLAEQATAALETLETKTGGDGQALPEWAKFPAGVAWSLREAGLSVAGVQAVFSSEIPIGAGLSSSAAVEVGFAVMWQALGGWERDRMALARLCQRAENEYVGVSSGLMDQFACACGVAGHALYLDTRSLEWEAAPIPPEAVIVVADSGMRRTLSGSAYNERRASCEQAVRELQAFLPDLRSLRDVTPTEFAAYAPYITEIPRRRAEHVVKEIARVQSALTALHRADLGAFGALMYAGHAGLRDLYEVSTPELDSLVALARTLPGCYGARLTGAGFGGCTVNLVAHDQAQAFIDGLGQGYRKTTGREARVYLCRADQGASVL